ncbi:hypothetical protein HY522_08980 [bacterium]|nr:hypothetical protein [bacterium]
MLKETIAAVLSMLNRHKVPFVFFGLEALNMHLGREGKVTFGTEDCDFLFDAGISSPVAILNLLKKTPFPEEVHITWTEAGRTMTVFDGWKWKSPRLTKSGTFSIFTPAAFYHMDLAVGDTGVAFKDIWRDSVKFTYYGTPVRLASKSHLIEMKRLAGREKDKDLLVRLRYNEKSGKPKLKKRTRGPSAG